MTQPVRDARPGPVVTAAPAGRHPQEQTLADLVAAAVRGVPGVAGLDSGSLGGVATYLPGRRVSGVAERGDRLAVSISALPGLDLRALALAVRSAVATVDPRPVDVTVADIAADTAADTAAGATAG